MAGEKKRDDFDQKVKDALCKRASYICSNPDCRCLTLFPAENDPERHIYVGKVAHITAASENGPRYDPSLTSEQRCSVENGIFLCSNCAEMIDRNNGLDFSVNSLKEWKRNHEKWIKQNLNKGMNSLLSTIDGEHYARGKGKVTALDIQEPTFLKPGTKSVAEGEGEITATRIAYKGEEKK